MHLLTSAVTREKNGFSAVAYIPLFFDESDSELEGVAAETVEVGGAN